MNIKYFDDAQGKWMDATGNIGDSLFIDASGWVAAPPSQPYKSLVLGNVNQSGEGNTPTFDILENTTNTANEDYSFTYNSIGDYTFETASGTPFTSGKVAILISGFNQNGSRAFGYSFVSDTEINFLTYGGGGSSDDVFIDATIDIRIYP
jgi:hypothetical protein